MQNEGAETKSKFSTEDYYQTKPKKVKKEISTLTIYIAYLTS